MATEQQQPKLRSSHYFRADKRVGPDSNIETAPVTVDGPFISHHVLIDLYNVREEPSGFAKLLDCGI